MQQTTTAVKLTRAQRIKLEKGSKAVRGQAKNRTKKVASKMPDAQQLPPADELSAEELTRIGQMLRGFRFNNSDEIYPQHQCKSSPSGACTDAWADSIIEVLQVRKRNGKRLIPYAVSPVGTLKTKFSKLLEMIADAMIYPPASDDNARCYLRPRSHHLGSEMGACKCVDCRGKVFWPNHYLVGGAISYTCAVNHQKIDKEVLEAMDPVQYLELPGVREIAITMRTKVDAWRKDPISNLNIEDTAAIMAMKRHRWSQVIGEEKARIKLRGLNNLGALSDFLELGHLLDSIPNIGLEAADEIRAKLAAYPKTPRMKKLSMKAQKLRQKAMGKIK